jgi:hypothetical protein
MKYLLLIVAASFLISGCSFGWSGSARTDVPESEPAPKSEAKPEKHARGPLHIPPGHLPAPGECRIWIPGTPPGHQPPPGDCAELAADVPAGAWLVSRGSRSSKEVDVAVYDDVLVDLVIEVRIYSTKDGRFLGLR